MSDGAALALAAVVGLGAWLAYPVPLTIALGLAVVAFAFRKSWVLLLAGALAASSLSHAAWVALDEPLPPRVDGVATLTKDPEFSFGALKAEVDYHDRRYQLWARDDAAKALRPMLAGQRITVSGTTGQLSGLAEPSLRRKHVAGRISATSITVHDEGNAVARGTNELRRLLVVGSQSLPDEQRSLLMGVVLGDDREQTQELRDAFKTLVSPI